MCDVDVGCREKKGGTLRGGRRKRARWWLPAGGRLLTEANASRLSEFDAFLSCKVVAQSEGKRGMQIIRGGRQYTQQNQARGAGNTGTVVAI